MGAIMEWFVVSHSHNTTNPIQSTIGYVIFEHCLTEYGQKRTIFPHQKSQDNRHDELDSLKKPRLKTNSNRPDKMRGPFDLRWIQKSCFLAYLKNAESVTAILRFREIQRERTATLITRITRWFRFNFRGGRKLVRVALEEEKIIVGLSLPSGAK